MRINRLRSSGADSVSVNWSSPDNARACSESDKLATPHLLNPCAAPDGALTSSVCGVGCELADEPLGVLASGHLRRQSNRNLHGVLHNSFLPNASDTIPFSCDSPRKRSEAPYAPPSPLAPQVDVATPSDADAGDTCGRGPLALEPFLAGEMPRGRFILFNLLSTWGDLNEVGLNGIEVFDEKGERIIPPRGLAEGKTMDRAKEQLQEKVRIEGGFTTVSYRVPNNQLFVIIEHPTPYEMASEMEMKAATVRNSLTHISSDESALVVSTQGNSDPRRCVSNILNGVNNTHDETCLFTMPYSSDNHHLVGFILPSPVTIAMVRIHNYGGSGRVHTNKGVRLLEMTVDDKLAFRGEIAENSGEVIRPYEVGLRNCENILFTEDETVLQRMLSNDAESVGGAIGQEHRVAPEETSRTGSLCPSTFSTGPSNNLCASATTLLVCSSSECDSKRFGNEKAVLITSSNTGGCARIVNPEPSVADNGDSEGGCPRCPSNVTSLCMMLLGTWGDTEKIGLSGIRLRDVKGNLVSQYITHWYVRFPLREGGDAHVHDDSCGEFDVWADQLQYLFDENAETAMTLPCVRGVEVIFVFATPLPTLGLLEVANYSQGEHTFCGVKEARLFLSSTNCSSSREQHHPESFVTAYAALWAPDGTKKRGILAAHGIYEVTPEEGVSLRKAPAFLTIPRFQSYDLSLGSGPDGLSVVSGTVAGGSALQRPLSQSLTASMTIRAEMSMRRARMALKPRPKWLLEYQPYLTPLLPVAYVLKLNLTLCARGTKELKAYAKEWMLNPLRACTFADENGERIGTRGSGSVSQHLKDEQRREGKGSRRRSDGSAGGSLKESCGVLQTECLFTALPNAIQQDAEAAAVAARVSIHASLVQACISLVYVADTPFCLSVLSLNRPLVMDGRTAWVKQIRVLMDDTLVFDSGDAGVPQAVAAAPSEGTSAQVSIPGDDDVLAAGRYRPTGFNSSTSFVPLSVHETAPRANSPVRPISSGAESRVSHSPVTYRTRLKPFVFFTLDSAVLEEAREEAARSTW